MDTVSNMLSTIKNAALAEKKSVEIPYSRMSEDVLKVMKEQNFIDEVKVFKPEGQKMKMLHVDLKYDDGISKISDVKRVSKPSLRVYKGNSEIKRIAGGYGISIVSTSKGIMDGMEARKKKLGGEVICNVY